MYTSNYHNSAYGKYTIVWINLHSRGLASSIVAEEGGNLSFIEPQGQSVNSQFVSVAVNLHKILNVNTWIIVAWFLLDTNSCG